MTVDKSLVFSGYVWKYGDNVDTDAIIPARYLNVSSPEVLAQHCMEDAVLCVPSSHSPRSPTPCSPRSLTDGAFVDDAFVDVVQPGDIIVGGENFGCGSSREHAPLAIKASGIACVIAESFARIFYRNAINIGLPILMCPEAASGAESGDHLTVDLEAGTITNHRTGDTHRTSPFPPFIMAIIQAGGLVPYTREKLRQARES
jgi:3-isopropylmalate/(R)-2-methylmalate dehydratase small subunit